MVLDILKKNSKNDNFDFEIKMESEDKLIVFVTWIRTERLSLTIRNVKLAE